MQHFEKKGYVTKTGKMKDTMKNALLTGTLDLPKKFEAARERLESVVKKADNTSLKEMLLLSYATVAQSAFDNTPFEGVTKFPNKEQLTPLTATEPKAKPTMSPLASSTPSVPDSLKSVLNVMNDGDKIEINAGGSEVTFPDAQPFIDENNRTQIPIRAVAESIGCKVDYDAASQTVSIDGGDESIVLRIGDENMDVNGETVKMDTAARIVDDRTYIPMRFVAEALGYEVDYITDTNQN